MKSFILKNTTICDPTHPLHLKVADIWVHNGTIKSVGKKIKAPGVKEINAEGEWAFPGWIDTLSYCGAPGHEEDEDVQSLAKTALAGGFTSIATIFGREQAVDKGSDINAIMNAVKNEDLKIIPIGNISHQKNGAEMAELYDMEQAGAGAFFDGINAHLKSALSPIVTEYAQGLKSAIYYWPWESKQYPGALVGQSITSTQMGLKGFPPSMESAQLQVCLQHMDGSTKPAYFPYLTTAESISLAKKHKNNFYGIPIINLAIPDESLIDFHENLKVMPPLRPKSEIAKLKKALADGHITCINSNHLPLNKEVKECEFLYAKYGAAGLQTVGTMLYAALGAEGMQEHGAQLLSYGGSQVLNLQKNEIKEGQEANITLFNPRLHWELNAQTNKSKSRNYATWGQNHIGKCTQSVVQGKLHIHA
jgi:dihydroorotase